MSEVPLQSIGWNLRARRSLTTGSEVGPPWRCKEGRGSLVDPKESMVFFKHGLSSEQFLVSAYWELEEPKGPKEEPLGMDTGVPRS